MFEVCILGTNSAVPAFGRNPTSQFVTHFGNGFLIDCAESTQIQIQRFKQKLRKLDVILISHLHGDHVLGLPGLVTSLSMASRSEPLTIIGPPGIKHYLDTVLEITHSTVKYELVFKEIAEPDFNTPVYETDRLAVFLLPLVHRIPTFGYRFVEKPKRKKFLFHEAKRLGVPNEYMPLVKQWNAITLEDGTVIMPEQLHTEPDPSYSYAYCSDTAYHEALVPFIENSTVLYHESTFTKAHAGRAEDTQHSTAEQAATIAKMAGVDSLFLGHYSARYKDLTPILQEAREVFANSYLAHDGLIIKIPNAK